MKGKRTKKQCIELVEPLNALRKERCTGYGCASISSTVSWGGVFSPTIQKFPCPVAVFQPDGMIVTVNNTLTEETGLYISQSTTSIIFWIGLLTQTFRFECCGRCLFRKNQLFDKAKWSVGDVSTGKFQQAVRFGNLSKCAVLAHRGRWKSGYTWNSDIHEVGGKFQNLISGLITKTVIGCTLIGLPVKVKTQQASWWIKNRIGGAHNKNKNSINNVSVSYLNPCPLCVYAANGRYPAAGARNQVQLCLEHLGYILETDDKEYLWLATIEEEKEGMLMGIYGSSEVPCTYTVELYAVNDNSPSPYEGGLLCQVLN